MQTAIAPCTAACRERGLRLTKSHRPSWNEAMAVTYRAPAMASLAGKWWKSAPLEVPLRFLICAIVVCS